MTAYVIAPTKPTHSQILKAAHAILNRAPTPDEYRDLFTAYQEMLSGQPDYGPAIVEKDQLAQLHQLMQPKQQSLQACIDLDAALHQISE